MGFLSLYVVKLQLWQYQIFNIPPPKKKVLVTGIDRGQYGLLASGPGALAGLLPTNRVTQPPNFLSKVVFAGGVKVKGTLFDTSFFIVLYHSRHVVTQFDNLN